MNTGMLWFDNNPQTDIGDKIGQAATYYQKKYGKKATLCFVNPKMVEKKKSKLGKIEIRASKSIMPNHIWIGDDQTPT